MPIPSSIDEVLASAATNGLFNRLITFRDLAATPTPATANCGNVTGCRHEDTFTMPSVGAGLTGLWPTTLRIGGGSSNSTAMILAIEYLLGTLTINGNSFAAGVTMPTKTVMGASLQTASIMPMLVSTATLTATTPVITITYTDQAGNTGQTCTMTLPTNVVNRTAYSMVPHLAAGDTGVRAVTNMSTSAGTAGTLRVYGLLPLAEAVASGAAPVTKMISPSILAQPRPIYIIEPNEVLAAYFLEHGSSRQEGYAHLAGVAA